MAMAGVELWRIQALARHSSSATLKYIENSHLGTLSSVAAEAASGRSLDLVRAELEFLKAELARTGVREPPPVPPDLGKLKVPLLPADVLPAALAVDLVTAGVHVGSHRRYSKVHRWNPELPSHTLCKWEWAASSLAAQCDSLEGLSPLYHAVPCKRCETRWGLLALQVEQPSDPEDSPTSDSSSSESSRPCPQDGGAVGRAPPTPQLVRK